jgi:hypothetical protein
MGNICVVKRANSGMCQHEVTNFEVWLQRKRTRHVSNRHGTDHWYLDRSQKFAGYFR